MTETLRNKLDAIVEACERHGVIRLDAFGSALRDEFQSGRSDVDLLVELGSMEPYDRVDDYFGLLEDLRAILGEQVDLVISGAVKNPYIAREIARTKELLYAV
ncbi:MAG: nucleotidyltransferase domain-containing protein [Gemmatimonadota bacterium]|nr:nucleotidyltransferase domain-containing protein [Gemmatimonadota bacterium]